MPIPFEFDFKNPDYLFVFKYRAERLNRIRQNPSVLPTLYQFYRDNIAQFIIDWGCTVDPRNIEIGRPAMIPFLLFQKQEEWVNWFIDCWRSGKFCLTEKSRDMGISWLAMSVSVSICLLNDNVNVGIGSRKEDCVDQRGDPNSLFWKGREFIKHLPVEFRRNWNENKNSAHMRLIFPTTNSAIVGEAGKNMGRGGRTSFTFVDEAAHLEHPEMIETSLSQTTNCRCDISTPFGMANPFAQKRHSGKIPVFILDWRDHPAKDLEWYERTCDKIGDPVIIEQEINRSYTASVPGIVIPAVWVTASIDAHLKLNITVSGIRKVGFDVADRGADLNSLIGRHGILVEKSDIWSGKHDDIFISVEKVFSWCDIHKYSDVDYDADGLGASVRGDAKVINDRRQSKISFTGFQGSGSVVMPHSDAFERRGIKNSELGRKNVDFYENRKSQAWWSVRRRFEITYLAVTGQINKSDYSPDEIISLSSKIDNLYQLRNELSQPTYSSSKSGKLLINKSPENTKSPNLADALVIAFSPAESAARFVKNFSIVSR